MRTKRFTIDQFFIGLLCVSLLIAIAVVSFAPHLLERFDNWCNDMKNQLIIIWSTVGLLSIFGVSRAVKYFKK